MTQLSNTNNEGLKIYPFGIDVSSPYGQNEERLDPLTRERFIPFRENQLFACAANRIKFNNRKANALRRERAVVEKPLLRNYRVLKELMAGKQEAVFHWEYLRGAGFDKKITTHVDYYDGKKYFAVFHFLLIHMENEQKTKIIRKTVKP